MNRRLHLYGLPTLVALVSLLGLVVGLLGDGGFDVVAGLALALPAAIILWSLAKARRGGWG